MVKTMKQIADQSDYENLCKELKLKELKFNVLCQQIQLLRYHKELMEQGHTKEDINFIFDHNPFDDMKWMNN